MSSTERAPEPTMEEILASIRRIISEDEGNAERQDAAPEGYVQPSGGEEPEEGIADTQIIADIERVLAGAGGPAEPAEDEILDLTDAGLVEAESTPEIVGELVVTEVVEEISIEPEPRPSFMQAFPPDAEETFEPDAPAQPVEAVEAASFEAQPPYAAEQPEPEQPYYEPPAPEPVSAAPPPAEDPTAALERAIAALKAGDLAAFAREAESKYAAPAAPSMPSAAPPPMAAHEPLPTAGPSLEEQFAAPEEPQPLEEPPLEEPPLEEELVILSEPQPELGETSAWSPAEEQPAPEGVATPWHSDETTWAPKAAPTPEPAAPSPKTNGGSGHKTHDFAVQAPQTLEDSVKEMLRPMLRKWLDENMQRVLTQALREELEDPQAPRRD